MRQIKEEKISTEKSLEICAQLSEHISKLEAAFSSAGDKSKNGKSDSVSENIARESLEECKKSLSRAATKLQNYEKELFGRLIEKMKETSVSSGDVAELATLREEWESTRESMNFLSVAGDRFEHAASTIKNHATGDAMQIMVSTNGKTLFGTNEGFGWRSRQIGGHMDDETVRQISKDMVSINIRHSDTEPRQEDSSSSASQKPVKEIQNYEFMKRHGDGVELGAQPTSRSNT